MLEWSPAGLTDVKSSSDSLLSIYRASAVGNRWDAHTILPYWVAAVGRQLAGRTRPTFLANGHLTVEVDGAEWRQELFPLSGTILARINRLLGEPLVHRIDYRLARPQRRPPGRAQSATGKLEPLDEASGIQDPQLRRLYRASMRASMKRSR